MACESALKRDPAQMSRNALIRLAEFVRGGVPIGADRNPPNLRLFTSNSIVCIDSSRGLASSADSHPNTPPSHTWPISPRFNKESPA
jgi:hypothetical protein